MLYILIDKQRLSITNTTTASADTTKTYDLDELTIKDCVIYNKNTVLQIIKDFLSNQQLKKTKAILNIPDLANKLDLPRELALLQFALIFGKSGIKLEKITGFNPPEHSTTLKEQVKYAQQQSDLLHIFKPAHDIGVKTWSSLTLIVSAGILLLFFRINQQNNNLLSSLNNQIIELQSCPQELAIKTKHFAELKNQNTNLDSLIASAQKYAIKTQNPLQLLTTISSKIPNNMWLTKIECGNKQQFKNAATAELSTKSKTKHKPRFIEITGFATKINSPYNFNQRLERHSKCIRNPKIAYIKKIKIKDLVDSDITPRLYEFKIIGKHENSRNRQ